ncbi:hypothetical protein DMP23_19940 [Amycolatopsis sp. A1MSW2902]|uniref:condensation domain-containing protein n=1 Tax=Amycolatopsis sp. A1MSW2902 TaxID=687413 RepID=UPI00307F603E
MDVGELLGQLAVLDVQLTIQGDDLAFDAPEEVLTKELAAQLTMHKQEILRYLDDESLRLVERTGPATPIQRQVALRHDAAPRPEVWNVPVRVDLSGTLDVAALVGSLTQLVKRHQVLRTRFAWLGEVLAQQVLRFERLNIITTDLRDPVSTRDEISAALDQWCTEIAHIPFSLLSDASMRVGLARSGPDQWTLILLQHHILTDAVSVSALLADLSSLYRKIVRGGRIDEDSPEQFIDYVRRNTGDASKAATAHWHEQLVGARAGVRLPFPKARPLLPSGAGRLVCHRLGDALRAELSQTAHRAGVTVFTVAFTRLLSILSSNNDVLITRSFANRSDSAAEILPGLFTNPLPIRVRFAQEETVGSLLRAVARQISSALDHQELPQPLVRALDRRLVTAVEGGTVVGFSMNHDVSEDLELPGVEAKVLDVPIDAARTDLMVVCVEEQEGLVLQVEYSTDVLDEQTVSAWLARFENPLCSVDASFPAPIAQWVA